MLHGAIEWYEDRSPEQKRDPRERGSLAVLFLDVGRLDEAQVLLEGLMEDYGPEYRAGDLAQLGVVAARRGDREEAYRISRLLEERDRSLNLPQSPEDGAYERARIAAALGERERAMELLHQSRTHRYSDVHLDLVFEPLWDYPPFKELLRPKG